jgi:hypothetical protein
MPIAKHKCVNCLSESDGVLTHVVVCPSDHDAAPTERMIPFVGKLLSARRRHELGGPMGGGLGSRALEAGEAGEILQAYDRAMALIEAMVRETNGRASGAPHQSLHASDVAWLELRETQR